MTKEQALDILNQWQVAHGMPPTVEEFRKAAKFGSIRTAFRYLEWLEEEGCIERWPGARGIKTLNIPGMGLQTQAVPIIGTTAAGPLMLAEENLDGWVRLPQDFIKPAGTKHFLLRVKGDSMDRCRIAGDAIENGDLVLVRQQASAQKGDVVVALIDGESTIKRLMPGPGYHVLKPESSNPRNKPILVKEDFRVQGIVSRVLKNGSELLV